MYVFSYVISMILWTPLGYCLIYTVFLSFKYEDLPHCESETLLEQGWWTFLMTEPQYQDQHHVREQDVLNFRDNTTQKNSGCDQRWSQTVTTLILHPGQLWGNQWRWSLASTHLHSQLVFHSYWAWLGSIGWEESAICVYWWMSGINGIQDSQTVGSYLGAGVFTGVFWIHSMPLQDDVAPLLSSVSAQLIEHIVCHVSSILSESSFYSLSVSLFLLFSLTLYLTALFLSLFHIHTHTHQDLFDKAAGLLCLSNMILLMPLHGKLLRAEIWFSTISSIIQQSLCSSSIL